MGDFVHNTTWIAAGTRLNGEGSVIPHATLAWLGNKVTTEDVYTRLPFVLVDYLKTVSVFGDKTIRVCGYADFGKDAEHRVNLLESLPFEKTFQRSKLVKILEGWSFKVDKTYNPYLPHVSSDLKFVNFVFDHLFVRHCGVTVWRMAFLPEDRGIS